MCDNKTGGMEANKNSSMIHRESESLFCKQLFSLHQTLVQSNTKFLLPFLQTQQFVMRWRRHKRLCLESNGSNDPPFWTNVVLWLFCCTMHVCRLHSFRSLWARSSQVPNCIVYYQSRGWGTWLGSIALCVLLPGWPDVALDWQFKKGTLMFTLGIVLY